MDIFKDISFYIIFFLAFICSINCEENHNYLLITSVNLSDMTEGVKQNKIGDYVIGHTIGQGTFGKVKLGIHLPTGQKVAIKILVKSSIIDVADVERVSRQIHILKIMRHPSIIQLYEVIETDKYLFLVMEYVEKGELFDFIVQKGRVEEEEASKFYKRIISGIAYLHELNIVHRDLKPQNLLIDFNQQIKIVDFGLSNTYKTGELLKTACGSPCYASPEMISSKKYNGLQVDIWSSGVVLFAMVCGYLPFEDSNTAELYKKILAGNYILPQFVSDQFRDLIEKVLNVDPSKRYGLSQIFKHPWCSKEKIIPLKAGVVVGYHRITVDKTILQKLPTFGHDIQYSSRCIEANKHNSITTTYYLLLKRANIEGYKSTCDINSTSFDYQAIEPFRRVAFNQQKYLFYATNQETPLIAIDHHQICLNPRKNLIALKVNSPQIRQDKNNQTSQKSRKSIKQRSNEKAEKTKSNIFSLGGKKFHDLSMYLKPENAKKSLNSQEKLFPMKRKHFSLYQDRSRKRNENSVNLRTDYSEQKRQARDKSKSSILSQKKKMTFKINGIRAK